MKPIILLLLFFGTINITQAQTDPDFFKYKKQADDCFAKKDYACAEQNYKRALVVKGNDEYCKGQVNMIKKQVSNIEKVVTNRFSDLIGLELERRLQFYQFLKNNVNNTVFISLRISTGGYEIRNYGEKCNASLDLNTDTEGYTTFSIRLNLKNISPALQNKSDCWETGFFEWYSPQKQEIKGKFLIKKYTIQTEGSFPTTDYTMIPQ